MKEKLNASNGLASLRTARIQEDDRDSDWDDKPSFGGLGFGSAKSASEPVQSTATPTATPTLATFQLMNGTGLRSFVKAGNLKMDEQTEPSKEIPANDQSLGKRMRDESDEDDEEENDESDASQPPKKAKKTKKTKTTTGDKSKEKSKKAKDKSKKSKDKSKESKKSSDRERPEKEKLNKTKEKKRAKDAKKSKSA
ncbi:uncharacterized protein BJ171DRAFT_499489 [Polychytrium aggregatum]|uniref:uncharacterized protein n=1 Tax=Polychytrium aggregatum TaxID=110093 RepID=UPI0022FF175D|nr:uncharacterized protein BJ171DRAFT_499489 [Polychytrium aggregatum]KAI9205735.1 hypothetical protein BJ171DRAFT_499489 [Polychytrium aggregatum]